MEASERLPVVGARAGSADAPSAEGERVRVAPFRDSLVWRVCLRLLVVIALLGLGLVTCVGLIVFLLYRGPVVITIDRFPDGTRKVVEYNGTTVKSDNMTIAPPTITDQDKTDLAQTFAKLLYNVDPATRGRDIPAAVRLMESGNAAILMKCIERGCDGYGINLQREEQERWQGPWQVPDNGVTIGPYDKQSDAYTVDVIGWQHITRVVNNQGYPLERQLRLSVKLTVDPEGKTQRNLRTGLRVLSYEYKELSQQ